MALTIMRTSYIYGATHFDATFTFFKATGNGILNAMVAPLSSVTYIQTKIELQLPNMVRI